MTAKMCLPAGMTMEGAARYAIRQIDEKSFYLSDVAKNIGCGRDSLCKAVDIVRLSECDMLTNEETLVVGQATQTMNETRTVKRAYKMTAPIMKRVWGESRGGNQFKNKIGAARKNFQTYAETVHGMYMLTCAVEKKDVPPPTDKKSHAKLLREAREARRALAKIVKKVEEVRSW